MPDSSGQGGPKFRVKIGEVHKRTVFSCGDGYSIWVEVAQHSAASHELAPSVARELASLLQAAANAAENIPKSEAT